MHLWRRSGLRTSAEPIAHKRVISREMSMRYTKLRAELAAGEVEEGHLRRFSAKIPVLTVESQIVDYAPFTIRAEMAELADALG